MTTYTARVRRQTLTGTLADISAQYAALRDASGEGASTFPWPDVVDANGQTVGRLSYNGKVFNGDECIYSPFAVRPVSDFTEGQSVILTFDAGQPDQRTQAATIVRNIDATSAPLTDMWLVETDAGSRFGISGAAITPAPAAKPNTALFVIQYEDADIWMLDDGNLGSLCLARVFDTVSAAQLFLDTRKLRPGFRPCLAVQPLTEDMIHRMVEEAAKAYACAVRHNGDVDGWLATGARIRALLPLSVH